MTSLAAPAPLATAKPAAVSPPVFGPRIIIGLVGVLLAVLVSGLNEMVTKVALADIRGALYIGFDEGTWLVAAYTATSVSAMAFAPWCSVTFSLRRFTLWAIGLFTLLGVLCPLAPNYESLLVLRTLQGLAGGALPPMLMTVALRFLPANVKLYGLAGYALTATFGPSLGTPLAALWTEYVGWQWAFWQIVAPCLLAMAAVAYGLPQDPLRLERLKQFNWRGLLLGFPAICMLVIGILQGNRLDWFESPLITTLLIGGVLLLVLFMLNEWSHPMPFFKLQMLGLRNLAFALIVLAGVLVVLQAVIILPSSYLAQVQGYRPLQTAPVMLIMALPQLIALPLVAALCNLRWVDCRWVLGIGLGMLTLSCIGGAQLTSAWIRDEFYVLQPAANFRAADGGVAAVDAVHRQHRARRRAVCLGLVQHGQGPGRGDRHRGAGGADHPPPAFPLDHAGGRPGQLAPGRQRRHGPGPPAAPAGRGADFFGSLRTSWPVSRWR
jgi:MFS transporter, DHA2 family, multidrug resistance protein